MNSKSRLWELSAHHEPIIHYGNVRFCCKSWDGYIKEFGNTAVFEWKWWEHDKWMPSHSWQIVQPAKDQDVLVVAHATYIVEVYVHKRDEFVIRTLLQRFPQIVPSLHTRLSLNECMNICQSIQRVVHQMTLSMMITDYLIECRLVSD